MQEDPAAKQRQWIRVLIAWLLPVGACVLHLVFWDQLEHHPWILFYPAVFFAARIGGLWGGLGATALASVLGWFFVLPPAFSFDVNEAASPLAVAIFFGTGVAFSLFDQVLRTSQAQYRTLFNQAGEGIVRVSKQGVFLDANQRFAEILGRTRSEIIGVQLADVVAGMTTQVWDDINAQLHADGSLVQERQLRRADGEIVPVEVTVTALPGGEQLAMVHDISKRKRAQAALKQSEEKWRLLFNLLPVGVSVIDAGHNVTDTNTALAQILGLSAEGILAGAYRNRRYLRPDQTLMTSDEFPSRRALSEQQVIRNVEIGVEKEDGEIVWTSVSATPVSDSGYSATVTVDISERKRSEEALAAAAANMKAVIENTGDYIWSVDQERRLLIANSAFQRSIQGQIGRNLAAGECVTGEPFAASARAFWEPLYMRALAGETLTLEIPFARQAEGSLEMSLYPIRDIGGKVVGVAGRAVDISARRGLEQAVRASEERLRLALDAANEGIWDWNVVTGEVSGNDQWFRFFGYTPGEEPASVNLWSSMLHPDDAPAALRTLSDYLQGRRPDYRNEYRIVTRSGEIRWGLSVGKIVARDAQGRAVRMVGTNADITGRKAAELQLRDSEERFRLLVQNSPVPILIWNEDTTLRYASPAIATALGITPERLHAITAALHAFTAELGAGERVEERLMAIAGMQEMNAANWRQVLQTVQYCAQHPGERTQLDLRVSIMAGDWRDLHVIFQGFGTSSSGVEIVCIIHDISEHRAMQRLLEETNAELEQQVVVRTAELQETVAELRRADAGKDAFLAAISHELRTPLMGVLSMSELLASEERGSLNSNQVKYVNAISDSGERLLATVNSVLLYTSVIAGNAPANCEPCQLNALCAAAVRAVEMTAARKQQHITQAVVPFDLEIESDPQSILNIIKTLLANAVKFTPEAGTIDLSVSLAPETGPGAGAGTVAESVQIVVTDSGIGMSEEQISGLFRPFVQGDQTLARRFEGLGLGLAYVQRMVELLGGTTAVASKLGQGSRISVTLPVSRVV